jgi:hypothetical protein
MPAVRMVEVIADQVVDVIAVRHGLVPALLAVHVIGGVAAAAMLIRAAVRVRVVDLEHMLVDVTLMGVVQMTLVQVVDVIAVRDAGMTAARAVAVPVIGMNHVFGCHTSSLRDPRVSTNSLRARHVLIATCSGCAGASANRSRP